MVLGFLSFSFDSYFTEIRAEKASTWLKSIFWDKRFSSASYETVITQIQHRLLKWCVYLQFFLNVVIKGRRAIYFSPLIFKLEFTFVWVEKRENTWAKFLFLPFFPFVLSYLAQPFISFSDYQYI